MVGQAAVTQAVLPRLRRSRGRVVFISSVSGRVATPMFGPYSASKFALEALADALRMELGPWGIRVVLVEPAQTDTDMWRRADGDLSDAVTALSPQHRELYAKHITGFRKGTPGHSGRRHLPTGWRPRSRTRSRHAGRERATSLVPAHAL